MKKLNKKASVSRNNINKVNDMSGEDPILGRLYMMGNVTKKLVITPDFPIGRSTGINI
jgi:hypothetical protein